MKLLATEGTTTTGHEVCPLGSAAAGSAQGSHFCNRLPVSSLEGFVFGFAFCVPGSGFSGSMAYALGVCTILCFGCWRVPWSVQP